MNIIEWGALGQVVVAGLIVGAGIPALFALALRLLAGTTAPEPATVTAGAATQGGTSSDDPARLFDAPVKVTRPTPARLVGAVACLAVVVGAVAAGIAFLVAGGH